MTINVWEWDCDLCGFGGIVNTYGEDPQRAQSLVAESHRESSPACKGEPTAQWLKEITSAEGDDEAQPAGNTPPKEPPGTP